MHACALKDPCCIMEMCYQMRVDSGGYEVSELEQLEQEVLRLSPEDLARFRAWFIELEHRLWDAQIEADLAAGKLDHLIAEARAEFKAGKAREL